VSVLPCFPRCCEWASDLLLRSPVSTLPVCDCAAGQREFVHSHDSADRAAKCQVRFRLDEGVGWTAAVKVDHTALEARRSDNAPPMTIAERERASVAQPMHAGLAVDMPPLATEGQLLISPAAHVPLERTAAAAVAAASNNDEQGSGTAGVQPRGGAVQPPTIAAILASLAAGDGNYDKHCERAATVNAKLAAAERVVHASLPTVGVVVGCWWDVSPSESQLFRTITATQRRQVEAALWKRLEVWVEPVARAAPAARDLLATTTAGPRGGASAAAVAAASERPIVPHAPVDASHAANLSDFDAVQLRIDSLLATPALEGIRIHVRRVTFSALSCPGAGIDQALAGLQPMCTLGWLAQARQTWWQSIWNPSPLCALTTGHGLRDVGRGFMAMATGQGECIHAARLTLMRGVAPRALVMAPEDVMHGSQGRPPANIVIDAAVFTVDRGTAGNCRRGLATHPDVEFPREEEHSIGITCRHYGRWATQEGVPLVTEVHKRFVTAASGLVVTTYLYVTSSIGKHDMLEGDSGGPVIGDDGISRVGIVCGRYTIVNEDGDFVECRGAIIPAGWLLRQAAHFAGRELAFV
jgi:hypothetical protein